MVQQLDVLNFHSIERLTLVRRQWILNIREGGGEN